jgi:hypothetical protein
MPRNLPASGRSAGGSPRRRRRFRSAQVLDLTDFSSTELRTVLDACADLKRRRRRGEPPAGEHQGLAAELPHRHVEGDAGAGRGLVEHHAEELAGPGTSST